VGKNEGVGTEFPHRGTEAEPRWFLGRNPQKPEKKKENKFEKL